ncbi:MAG: ABC transporter ATP-binding protein [Candidatus Latescibacterota bacterium]
MDAVVLNGVKKFYHEGEYVIHAVDGVDLVLGEGEFATLAGPSGSGKTTLLNLIGGLDRADEGEITVAGVKTNGKSDDELTRLRLHKIGFVFQAYNLIPVLTVYENIQFVLQIQGVPEQEHRGRIIPILERLDMAGFEKRFPTQISGGQQQRVAVARAVVGNPAIVLADEPTANLDSEASSNLLQLMRRLNEEKRVTFLFSSHDPLVIEQAPRVIRLRDGKIQADERKEG